MVQCIEHSQKSLYGSTHRVINGVKVHISLHRLAFYEANGYMPNVCRHKCDNPRCINPEHLEDGTHADNARDKVLRGRCKSLKGCSGVNSSLSTEDISSIHYDYKVKKLKQREIACKYKVSQGRISEILAGKTYAKQ